MSALETTSAGWCCRDETSALSKDVEQNPATARLALSATEEDIKIFLGEPTPKRFFFGNAEVSSNTK